MLLRGYCSYRQSTGSLVEIKHVAHHCRGRRSGMLCQHRCGFVLEGSELNATWSETETGAGRVK